MDWVKLGLVTAVTLINGIPGIYAVKNRKKLAQSQFKQHGKLAEALGYKSYEIGMTIMGSVLCVVGLVGLIVLILSLSKVLMN